jgi:hypothetical protein
MALRWSFHLINAFSKCSNVQKAQILQFYVQNDKPTDGIGRQLTVKTLTTTYSEIFD